MHIVKLSIETAPGLTDSLSDYLIGVLGAAVEFEVDGSSSKTVIHSFLPSGVYSPDQCRDIERQVADYGAEIAGILGFSKPSVTLEMIEDQDWSKSWKEHFKPFEIIPQLVIVPSWETRPDEQGKHVIEMDPGMAFGTGHHATTRLCMKMLHDSVAERPGCSVLDVGTGTGILAMASALFGAGRVLGLDNDPEAVKAARENVKKNRLGHYVEISETPLSDIQTGYEIVVANIVHDVLIDLAPDLDRVTRDGGCLIVSGLIEGIQVENIAQCFQQKALNIVRREQEGEWSALLLSKG